MNNIRGRLNDSQWTKIQDVLAVTRIHVRRPPQGRLRRFVDAVLWILRTGAPWRDLPSVLGDWRAIYRRFRRWAKAGTWTRLQRALQLNPTRTATEPLYFIDSTAARAHQHAAGARDGQRHQALGRSRGGFSTKIHVIVSQTGQLVARMFTGGECADITMAPRVATCVPAGGMLVGDKGYDSDPFVGWLKARNVKATIPLRRGRKTVRPFDKDIYARRQCIERYFARLKQFRRVATRYDKTTESYGAFVDTAAALSHVTGWK